MRIRETSVAVKEVSGRLGQDVRQGAHARKVMESYQRWFGEGPELSVLRLLGLFDRPADERVLSSFVGTASLSQASQSH